MTVALLIIWFNFDSVSKIGQNKSMNHPSICVQCAFDKKLKEYDLNLKNLTICGPNGDILNQYF